MALRILKTIQSGEDKHLDKVTVNVIHTVVLLTLHDSVRERKRPRSVALYN